MTEDAAADAATERVHSAAYTLAHQGQRCMVHRVQVEVLADPPRPCVTEGVRHLVVEDVVAVPAPTCGEPGIEVIGHCKDRTYCDLRAQQSVERVPQYVEFG